MYNRFNFFKNTFAVFSKTNQPENFVKPSYVSKHGSSYFFTTDGVYRYSNHWGRVGNCRWRLENIDHKQQTNYWGFCRWNHFYSNQEGLPLYYIEKLDNNNFSYNHKSNNTQSDSIFRSAANTASILKKIKELQDNDTWAKYLIYNDYRALLDYFINALITTNKSFIKIKQEYIALKNE